MKLVDRFFLGWLAGLLIAPASASAQDPTAVFADLPRVVDVGRQVVVTDADGHKSKGKIVEITPTSITLLTPDRWGIEQRQVYADGSVRAINRTDSVWNGLLIGLGAGIVGAELFVRHNCGPRGSDDECAAIATLVGWATFVPGGAATGALIDKLTGNKLLYRATTGDSTIGIAPLIGRRTGGVALSLQF